MVTDDQRARFAFVITTPGKSCYRGFEEYQRWLTQRQMHSVRRIQVNRDANWGGHWTQAPDLGGEG